MLIGTNGVIIDELAQVLLIRRNDTRTIAPPGGSLESGELPPDSLAREVREETGLVVMPVRLVGLYFLPLPPDGMLAFVFRCIQRGGQLSPTTEAPVVAFFPSRRLPGPMLPFHRQRLVQALSHRGGPPICASQPFPWHLRLAKFLLDNVIYRYLDLRRSWRKQPPFQPPTRWRCSAHLLLRDEPGRVFWQSLDPATWQLPGAPCHALEPPWETVRRIAAGLELPVEMPALSGVYLRPDSDLLQFVFTAQSGRPAPPRAALGDYFQPGQEPKGADPDQLEWVADASGPSEVTIFRQQPAQLNRSNEEIHG